MDAAQQPAGAGATRPASPRARKTRLVLLMVGGLVALLCLGGAGIAFVAYRDATEPDRSSPDVAVDNYLRAYLVDRDDVLANQYACNDKSRLDSLEDFRIDLAAREQRFNTTFTISWTALRVSEHQETADVAADLRLSAVVDGFQQSDLQPWTFELQKDNGWRVCGAKRL